MAKLLPLTLAIACNAELILDGGENGWSQWYRSVDGVMGGRSSISVQRDGDVLEASGEIVTAGGGFAGIGDRGARAMPDVGLRELPVLPHR